ncbi:MULTISPECIES: tetratricopeptide repeat protein [Cytobacillus]|uniref:tetratricopeptide repeat protein n=1 Tax=Cytobacillus TaxID=2675230 RepID=UPI001CD3A78B|nr:tetratricopeptide repeat protein [Cytobacillus kochii]MCA1027115.1 tetratricopeptide repeat protein [Cytobacillus kochii]MCM3320784.1 tetratricopeptide repeat protein [Cytobacillus kochii]MCM3344382.1 tetratricopeptide repeat protein [Cytobacillus kochii]
MDKVKKIIALLENGLHDEALEKYKEILSHGTHEERFVLAEELMQYGFLKEAHQLIERLLDAYPEEGELLVMKAEIFIDLGNEEEAVLVLEQVNQQDASYPQALLLLADLYQMEGLYEVSERKLLDAKAILPEEPIIDFALGELSAEQGKFLEAVKLYEKVLTKKELIGGVNVNQRMAESLSAGGAFEEALPYYEKALEEKLEIHTLFSYAFTALQAGYNQVAIEKFNELKEIDPEFHSLYLHLAKAYEREEQVQEALATVKLGIKQDEYNKELYFYGGKLALKIPDEQLAVDLLREALAIDPEYIDAAIVINKVFMNNERFNDVIEIAELMQSAEVIDPQLLWDAAKSYQEIEEYSQALNKYNEAYTYFKQQPDFLADYGYFLIEEGKRKEAAELFSKLTRLEPHNEEYQDILQRLSDES